MRSIMKKFYFGTNLKMYKNIKDTTDYLTSLERLTSDISRDEMELFVIPSYTSLPAATDAVSQNNIRLGAQNMGWADEGQFTGEISPLMLEELGIGLVMIGHSERRHVFHETDIEEHLKVKCGVKHGYTTLLCVGETDEEKEFLEETAQLMLKYPTIPCNDCKYCMPCPYGLDIPAILLHYNRCVNEGNVPENGQDENYAKARRAFLVGYDRSVPKLRQASHCIGCNQCVSHCPQNIDIPKELHRIDQFVEQLKQGTL